MPGNKIVFHDFMKRDCVAIIPIALQPQKHEEFYFVSFVPLWFPFFSVRS